MMLAFLQFDASARSLVERMMHEGRLPALEALKNRGRWLPLDAETDFFEAGVYATLYSGMDVGDHGLYYGFVWSAPDQRAHYLDFNGAPETVWQRLGRAGRRSLILDPYVPWRATALGMSISGWQLRHKIIPRWSSPSGAYRRYARRFGPTPLLPDISGPRQKSILMDMREILLAGPARVADLVVELLSRETFDFLWVSFISAHLTGHLFWDPSQVAAPDLDAADREQLASTVEDAYVAADAAIGRLVAALPPDTDVIVLSPLGMGPETSRSDLLPDMLAAILTDRSPDITSGEQSAGDSMWRFRARISPSWRARVARILPGAMVREIVARLFTWGIDWSRTQAFVLPGDHHGYVRLNVRGRESRGIVDPAAADSLLDKIAEGLMTFRDPDGRPSIASVERVKDRIAGARIGNLPDLVVRWSDRTSTGLTGVSSARFGNVARRGVGTGRTGNHVPGTWMIVAPGASRARDLTRPPKLTDLATTACDRLGADATGLQGESLLQAR